MVLIWQHWNISHSVSTPPFSLYTSPLNLCSFELSIVWALKTYHVNHRRRSCLGSEAVRGSVIISRRQRGAIDLKRLISPFHLNMVISLSAVNSNSPMQHDNERVSPLFIIIQIFVRGASSRACLMSTQRSCCLFLMCTDCLIHDSIPHWYLLQRNVPHEPADSELSRSQQHKKKHCKLGMKSRARNPSGAGNFFQFTKAFIGAEELRKSNVAG